ncbi:MAG: hypothetical protein ACXAC5_03570 [Promethearchaeota archaeon]|jgi:hypothetical protein
MSESTASVQVHQARNEVALTGFCNLAQYLSELLIGLRPKEGSIREKTSYHQLLTQLYDKEVISTSTLLTEMGLDYDQEIARLRKVKYAG